MEKWNIYDVNRQKTSIIKERGSHFEEGEYHLVVHLCIINSKREMLIQQRHQDKIGFGNYWDVSVGGSALVDENAQEAIARETLEELGLIIDTTQIRPKFSINFDHGFDDYFIVLSDIDLSQCILQENEVQAIKWASYDEIIEMMENNEFIPYKPEFIKLIFSSAIGYGWF